MNNNNTEYTDNIQINLCHTVSQVVKPTVPITSNDFYPSDCDL